jgi:hypothetical protein
MGAVESQPTLLTDAGVENRNARVDQFIGSGGLRRLLALTEIGFSNSIIECWWRTLNTQLPHSAFRGQTPDEMYFATGRQVPDELEARRREARMERLATNRATSCANCQHTKEAS